MILISTIENGIGVDDRQVTGAMARGVAALGANIIAVGIHTGTIVLFKVSTDGTSFQCSVFDTQRCHVNPITELASATINDPEGSREVLVSGDVMSHINIWQMTDSTLRLVKVIEPYGEFPITALTIWNKISKGVIIAGYGSGHLRLFSIPRGAIVAEATAHAGWITGVFSKMLYLNIILCGIRRLRDCLIKNCDFSCFSFTANFS